MVRACNYLVTTIKLIIKDRTMIKIILECNKNDNEYSQVLEFDNDVTHEKIEKECIN